MVNATMHIYIRIHPVYNITTKKMCTLTVHITLHCIFATYIFPLIQCDSLPIQLIPQLFGLQASVVDLIKCSGEFIGHLLIVGMLSLYCMTEPTSIICIYSH